MKDLKIFSGSVSENLAQSVAESVGVPLGRAFVSKFSDGELRVKIEENVRGSDCFVVLSTCEPANDNLMELLLLLDALRRSSPGRLTAVIPYFGYARQDKQDKARAPIAAKLVADLIVTAGAQRVMAMDLHAAQIQGFFNVPVDNLFAKPVLVEAIRRRFDPSNLTIVSPDVGGALRAREYAKKLGAPLAIIDKRRDRPNESEVMNVVGNVEDRNCVIIDDIVDTAGTLSNCVQAIRERGATRIVAAMTHPVLSGNAYENILKCGISMITTDTIPLNYFKYGSLVEVVSIAPLLSEAIRRTHNEESISSLFK